ncbi:MAG: hypothetical protein KDD69_15900 [Bdellovibrionales bacterium]|nr:hypothetical protein [Bdellovibrionales bacterium]
MAIPKGSKKKERERRMRERKRAALRAKQAPTAKGDNETRAQFCDRTRDTFGTTAVGWPIRYRRMHFDCMPDLHEYLNFAGSELHLEWYQNQEERRAGSNGEVVAALAIERCVQLKESSEREIAMRCEGTLIEHCMAGSTYGEWLRMQPFSGLPDDVDDEYRTVPVAFDMKLLKLNSAATKKSNRILQGAGQLPLLPNVWNVTFLKIEEELFFNGNALCIDRLYELMMMLRITVPRFFGARQFKEDRSCLERQLANIEEAERLAADLLTARSAATLDYLSKKSEQLQSKSDALAAALEKLNAIEAELAKIDTQLDEAETSANSSAIAKARSERSRLWSRRVGLLTEHSARAQELQQLEATIVSEFGAVAQPEWEAANSFSRQLYRWQAVWAEVAAQ